MYGVYTSVGCDNSSHDPSVKCDKVYGLGPALQDDVLAFCRTCLKEENQKAYLKHVKNGNIQDEDALQLIDLENKAKTLKNKIFANA
jgi:hypothetical protein